MGAAGRLTRKQVAKRFNVCERTIIRDFVGTGSLPWPGPDGCWSETDVAALEVEFGLRRKRFGRVSPKARPPT